MEKFQKCKLFAIFLIAEIQKIDLEALFFRVLKILTVKNLDLWVRIQFVKKRFAQGTTDFTEADF